MIDEAVKHTGLFSSREEAGMLVFSQLLTPAEEQYVTVHTGLKFISSPKHDSKIKSR